MSENEREKMKQKEDAHEEFQAGIDASQRGEPDAAIKHFSISMELDNENILSITRRSALYFDMGKYNECIADCIRAEERGQNMNVDDKLKATNLSLKGAAYLKLANCTKDYDLAIEALDMACKLHETSTTLKLLNLARSSKGSVEKMELLGVKQRESGNKLYKQNRIEAVKCYTEAIKLNPCDVKAYCNRALCYTLDGMLDEALKDAEKSLELEPTFVIRGYVRKGNIEFEKKEYNQALETYEMGLKHDAENEELILAFNKCREQMLPAADKDTFIKSFEALKSE